MNIFFAFSQKTIDYIVTNADVYLSGAKISSQSKIQLEAGTHTVYIKNITDFLVEGSLQAKVSNGANIVSVNSFRNYIESGELTKKEQELYETQKKLTRELRLLEIDKETIEEENSLIISLIKSDANNEKKTNYTVTELQNLSKFYADKVSQLKKANYDIEQQIQKVQEELNKVNAQLREERSVKNKNNQQVELTLHVTSSGTKTVELSYFVSNCGWVPQYDIKAENKDNPVEITYKASVWQLTGVDWNDTEITLMTNQPAQDQNRPILSPIFVDAIQPNVSEVLSKMSGVSSSKQRKDAVQMNMLEVAVEESIMDEYQNYAQVISTDINIVYKIAGKQSISGNGKAKILTMDVKKISSRFVYHAVPKLNEQVYLLAYIPNWHTLSLIDGNAAIYLQDAFIGNIYINSRYTGEEYPLSFGIDNRISIKRIKKQDFSSENKLASEKKEKLTYEFVIRNNLATDIEVEVLDQIPISKNKNVKVILEDKGDGEYIENIGLVKWMVPVSAGKSNTVKLSYELRYPKDNVLNYSYY
jgi:uncharacterized protein (TIGR02231 family)